MELNLSLRGMLRMFIELTFVAGVSTAIYLVGVVVYNIYLHPLSKFPGPKSFAASRIPSVRNVLKGRLPHKVSELHEQYGEVVRTAPDELAFSSPQAFQDIYSKHQGRASFPKDPVQYVTPPSGVASILSVQSDADHSRYRRLLSHAFSEKALREQEPIIKKYVDLLITRLHENAGEEPLDMVSWYNFTTFDIIGDLTLGEAFGCLNDNKYHPWVSYVFKSFKTAALIGTTKRFGPLFIGLLNRLIPQKLLRERKTRIEIMKGKVLARLDRPTDRKDFMTYVAKHNDKETGMSRDEIASTFHILLLAGSETTATLLSAATYYLLKNPAVIEKLVNEIRTQFKNEDEIDIVSVNKLRYQLAVLDETMRIHPPAPFGSPRVVPGAGQWIAGHWVPGGTNVSCVLYASHHASRNFTNPDKFAPERWLDDPEYAGDAKAAFQPFSLGPRNCVGRNLAYAEMRLILARTLWNFDMQLAEESSSWAENMKIYLLWEKPPLYVRLKPVVRE